MHTTRITQSILLFGLKGTTNPIRSPIFSTQVVDTVKV